MWTLVLFQLFFFTCFLSTTATDDKSTIWQVKGFEAIRGVVLEPLPFDVERDLVTPTFKLKRPQLLAYYKVCNIFINFFGYVIFLSCTEFFQISPFFLHYFSLIRGLGFDVQEKIDGLYASQKKQ